MIRSRILCRNQNFQEWRLGTKSYAVQQYTVTHMKCIKLVFTLYKKTETMYTCVILCTREFHSIVNKKTVVKYSNSNNAHKGVPLQC